MYATLEEIEYVHELKCKQLKRLFKAREILTPEGQQKLLDQMGELSPEGNKWVVTDRKAAEAEVAAEALKSGISPFDQYLILAISVLHELTCHLMSNSDLAVAKKAEKKCSVEP